MGMFNSFLGGKWMKVAGVLWDKLLQIVNFPF